jgi:hypothetical protein
MAGLQATSVIDGPTLTECLEMSDPGIGSDDDPSPGDMGTPTKIEILAVKGEFGVEATERFEQVGAHEGDTPLQVQNVSDRVELFLIEIALLDKRRGLAEVIT